MGSGAAVLRAHDNSRLADCRVNDYDSLACIEEEFLGAESSEDEYIYSDHTCDDIEEVYIDRPDCVAGDLYDSLPWV